VRENRKGVSVVSCKMMQIYFPSPVYAEDINGREAKRERNEASY